MGINFLSRAMEWFRKWWRRRLTYFWWRWCGQDQPELLDAAIVGIVLKRLSDRPREFIYQHCAVTLTPGIAGQTPILLIGCDVESDFDEPYAIQDLGEICHKFRVTNFVETVVVQEPQRSLVVVYQDNEWHVFQRSKA